MSQLQGRRIVVTGGAGFVGRKLCELLPRYEPAEVVTPRRADYDLTSAEAVNQLMLDARPEVVIHLAASVGGIGANRENPGRYFYENAAMGLHLIEAIRKHGVHKAVVLASICSYPKFTPVPFKEDDLWNGYPEETNAPYGLAKKMLLVQAQAYRQQYGTNIVTLFPVNLYGPGDNFDLHSSHVIPALIRKMIEAREAGSRQVVAWGTGKASREFLYVKDAAEGILLAADRYDQPLPVNLGAGQEITIKDLTETIARVCRFEGEIVWDTTKPDGQPRRCLDTSRAETFFGFKASTPLEEGLRETAAWYEKVRQT